MTVVGGKWTTCRKVAQDTIDVAAEVAGLSPAPSVTARLRVHGYSRRKAVRAPWKVYGSEAGAVRALEAADDGLATLMHPSLPYRLSQAAWAARHEMAVRVEDVLARQHTHAVPQCEGGVGGGSGSGPGDGRGTWPRRKLG